MQVVNGKRLGWYAVLRSMDGNQGAVLVKTGSFCAETIVRAKMRKLPERVSGVFLIRSSDTPESNLPIMILLLNDKKVLLQGFKTA